MIRNYTRGQIFSTSASHQHTMPGGLYITELRQVQAHLYRIMGDTDDLRARRIKMLAVDTLHNADLRVHVRDIETNGRVPRWVALDRDFVAGVCDYHGWIIRAVERGQAEDLAGELLLIGTKLLELVPEFCWNEDHLKWDTLREWEASHPKALYLPCRDGGRSPAGMVFLRDIRKRHLECFVHGFGAPLSYDAPLTTDEDETWEDHIISSAEDIADMVSRDAEAADIAGRFQGLVEDYDIKGDLIVRDDVLGVSLDLAKLAVLMRRLRQEDIGSPKVRGLLKALGRDLDRAEVDRVVSRVFTRFTGKTVEQREKAAELLCEREEEELKQLYEEEMEAAKRGEELSVQGAYRLDSRHKAALTKVRNAALRAAHGM